MLINLSNHPVDTWSNVQLETAKNEFGEVIDFPFPQVPPLATNSEIEMMAIEIINTISKNWAPSIAKLHIMGELTLCFALVNKLNALGYMCFASTTYRIATQRNNQKVSEFKFAQFRPYLSF